MEQQIPLGARVRFTRRILRIDDGRGHLWRAVECEALSGEGVFMGYRYKQNGRWERDWEEGAYSASEYWSESSRVKVALVVTDPWRDPATVDPNALELIPAVPHPAPRAGEK